MIENQKKKTIRIMYKLHCLCITLWVGSVDIIGAIPTLIFSNRKTELRVIGEGHTYACCTYSDQGRKQQYSQPRDSRLLTSNFVFHSGGLLTMSGRSFPLHWIETRNVSRSTHTATIILFYNYVFIFSFFKGDCYDNWQNLWIPIH